MESKERLVLWPRQAAQSLQYCSKLNNASQSQHRLRQAPPTSSWGWPGLMADCQANTCRTMLIAGRPPGKVKVSAGFAFLVSYSRPFMINLFAIYNCNPRTTMCKLSVVWCITTQLASPARVTPRVSFGGIPTPVHVQYLPSIMIMCSVRLRSRLGSQHPLTTYVQPHIRASTNAFLSTFCRPQDYFGGVLDRRPQGTMEAREAFTLWRRW